MKMKSYLNKRGFTLFEVIIALGLTMVFFAIIAIVSTNMSRTYNRFETIHERQIESNRLFQLIGDTLESYLLAGERIELDVEAQTLSRDGVEELEVILRFTEQTLEFRQANQATLRSFQFSMIQNVQFTLDEENDAILIVTAQLDESRIYRRVYHVIGGVDQP